MRLFRKTLIYLGIALVSIVILLILLAEYAEKPISKLAVKQINQTLGSELEIGNIEFSLLKDFPNAQLQLQNVKLKSDSVGLADILLLKNLSIEVEMMPLLDNKINIIEIRLEDGEANYQVYANTKSNIDFLIPADSEEEVSDTSSTQIDLTAPLIKTTGVKLFYKDEAENITATVILDAVSSVFMKGESGLSANAKGEVSIEKVNYPDTKAYLMEQTKMNVDINFRNDTAYLNQAELLSDGIKINASGWIGIVDNYPADLKITNSQFNLKELSKYIPDSLINDYKLTISDGILSADALISGDLLDSVVLPKISASIGLQELAMTALDYPAIKKLNTNITFSNGDERTMASSQIDIKDLLLATNKSSIKAKASVRNFDSPQYTFSSQADILLDEFSYLIPADLKTKMSGRVKANISNSGSVPDSITMRYINDALDRSSAQIWLSNLSVKMDSVIELQNMNGAVNFKNKNITAKNISCQLPEFKLDIKPSTIKGKYIGSIANIDQLGVKIDTFNLNANNSRLIGSAYVKNGKKPYYQTSATTHINLKDWSAFIPDSLLSEYSGELTADFESAGSVNLDSITDDAMRILFRESTLQASSKNLSLKTPDNLYNIENFNGNIFMNNDSISLEDISGSFNKITFSADSTSIVDTYKSVLLNQKDTLKMFGFVHLGNIDYAELAKLLPADDSIEVVSTDTTTTEPMNYSFDIKGKFSIDRFKYQNGVFENISSLYKLTKDEYIFDQFKFDAFKGHTNSSVKVRILPDGAMKIYFKNSTYGLDINQMLVDFDDFKEYGNDDYISYNQLSGTFSTDNLNGYFLYKDSIMLDSILVTADLKLENGRLHDYPLTAEMGRDYKIDGLEDLQFQTIETKLFVYGGAAYVPQTNIKTNTFDITLLGMQKFDLDCQYHLRVYLKEILRKGKTDRIEKKQSKESKQKDDGGTKGLTSVFAVYKVEDGETVKSTIEGKDSELRRAIQRDIRIKEAFMKLAFHPLLVKYNTTVDNAEKE
nr:AsmA family protein [uncultured Carboxylicivirga sp.]